MAVDFTRQGIDRGQQPCRAIRRAFTLIEVLVVVAIIALLITVLMPSLRTAREQTKRVQCTSNVHQQTLAYFAYASDFKGSMPLNSVLPASGASRGYVHTVVSPPQYDLRKMLRRYVGRNSNVLSCPSNGGPALDDRVNDDYLRDVGANWMSGHYMYLFNSTCVYQGTSVDAPWAPNVGWTAGGDPAGVPIVQDLYLFVGGTTCMLEQADQDYYFNHGDGLWFDGENIYHHPPGSRFKHSPFPKSCSGVSAGYLDGHADWVKNLKKGYPGTWTLAPSYSRSAIRVLSSGETNLPEPGVPLTVRASLKRP